MAFGMKNILQGGLAGNYSEVSTEELIKELSLPTNRELPELR